MEIAMRTTCCIVAAVTLAGMLAGCADPYAPRYGYSQGAAYPATYYQPTYYQPTPYSYYPSGPTYHSAAEYRNYNGIHPGPEYYP
jgi:hypothetical protein